jgi:hypothetical protein
MARDFPRSSLPEEGGFVQDASATSILSPPASVTNTPILPPTRKTPLKASSAKETEFILYVDHSLMEISRRHALRLDDCGPDAGYTTFTQAANDLDRLIDIIWTSGTRK